jgi:recombination DNA repair RAD52 pathway protein
LLEHEKWSYETSDFQIVQLEERTKDGKTRHYVGYTAKATVTWEGVTRSDVGFGQGIDADLGRAHESAIKEAATDALKRALRTFGQALGLALYDKSGEHISDYDEVEYRKSLGLTKDDAKHLKATFGDKLPKVMESAWAEKVYDRESMMAFADSYHCQEAGA